MGRILCPRIDPHSRKRKATLKSAKHGFGEWRKNLTSFVPLSLSEHLRRLNHEPGGQGCLWGLKRKHWYLPGPGAPSLAVDHWGQAVATPIGPAAGPHTQMAQNLLTAYAAGGRFLELKTVQVSDRLQLGRPCIFAPGIGLNTEWSQELSLEESLREYAHAALLIAIFQRLYLTELHQKPVAPYQMELSLGYDRKGLESPAMQTYLDQVLHIRPVLEEALNRLPRDIPLPADLELPGQLTNQATLSTFHGCPPEEIFGMVESLMERGFEVTVKWNPALLGPDRIGEMLSEMPPEFTVDPAGFDPVFGWKEAVDLGRSLLNLAREKGRRLGFKFCNTLPVKTPESLPLSESTAYLSGAPLLKPALELAALFRQSLGADIACSFSGGACAENLPFLWQSGFQPVTICTDLLQPGGYSRLHLGLSRLERMVQNGEEATLPSAPSAQALCWNLRPKSGPLSTFDCRNCGLCVSVCPNRACFIYRLPVKHFIFGEEEIRFEHHRQIALLAECCNQCGQCAVVCPEDGNPAQKKPRIALNSEGRGADFIFQKKADKTFTLKDGAGFTLLFDPLRQRGRQSKGGEAGDFCWTAQGETITVQGVEEATRTIFLIGLGLLESPLSFT